MVVAASNRFDHLDFDRSHHRLASFVLAVACEPRSCDPRSCDPHVDYCFPYPPSLLQLMATILVVMILILVVRILHLLCLQLLTTFLVVILIFVVLVIIVGDPLTCGLGCRCWQSS